MKLFSILIAALLMDLGAVGADLGDLKTVYLLPMQGGLDQYLAIRLTTGSILQVVTDPQKADAIFTDRIGSGFEETLAELYHEKLADKDKDKDDAQGFARPSMQAIARGRGTVFVVDRKTRNVVWATTERPRNSSADEISHVADKIAGKLAKSIKGK
jgi:hypothetical protein